METERRKPNRQKTCHTFLVLIAILVIIVISLGIKSAIHSKNIDYNLSIGYLNVTWEENKKGLKVGEWNAKLVCKSVVPKEGFPGPPGVHESFSYKKLDLLG